MNENEFNVKNGHFSKHSRNCEICKVTIKDSSIRDANFLLEVHKKVTDSGKYNFEGCRIAINSRLNIEYLRSLLHDFKDQQLCEFLEFGFPLGYTGEGKVLKQIDKKDLWKYKNHKGATDFPTEMIAYLEKESVNKAVLGPFKDNPFENGIKISPLNSLPKKDTLERRIILDLSFPKGYAVNDYVSKDYYLGEKIDLVFPKVDDFIQLIKQKGQGCLLFKKDLRRAYRQIPICPSNYNLVSFSWKKHIFCDTMLSMGLKSAAFLCQRFTNAIAYIMFRIGISILNYLDDLASAEKKENADFAYYTLGAILEKCGIEEAKNKSSPPSKIMTFVGVLFDTEKMTIEITSERLSEIRSLLLTWLNKEEASLKEIQSLLGKLNFVAACVRPSRIFISRMLKWLKILYRKEVKKHTIPAFVKKDILWWYKFVPVYNGVSMMLYEEWCKPDEIFSSDACLKGCGGFWLGKYFHTTFPPLFKQKKYNINILEMLAILIGLKLWGQDFRQKRIQVFCDNEPVCTIINSGRSNCEVLQMCLRELAFIAAINEFEVKAVHLEGRENRISDHLSRWHLGKTHSERFFELTKSFDLTECVVSENLFDFISTW